MTLIYLIELFLSDVILTKVRYLGVNLCLKRHLYMAISHLPGNLTVVDIKATFWHDAHTTLRVGALVSVQKVNIRLLICHFKVPDLTVSLNTE